MKTSESSQPAVLDIDLIETEKWSFRSFPIQGTGSRNVVQVVVKRSTLDAIRAHGLSRTDVEVCGVLVGGFYKDERGPFIYVENMIQGEHAENQIAQVTFTGETWSHIQDQMDHRFADKRVLGWYHTHPGFGIFLSPMDMFIHENFFNSSEQLALVYDPINGEDGLFVWHEGRAVAIPYLVQEDNPNSMPGRSELNSKAPRLTAAGHAENGLEARLARVERWLGWLALTAVLGVVASVGLSVAVCRMDWSAIIRTRSTPVVPDVPEVKVSGQKSKGRNPAGSNNFPDNRRLSPSQNSGPQNPPRQMPQFPQQQSPQQQSPQQQFPQQQPPQQQFPRPQDDQAPDARPPRTQPQNPQEVLPPNTQSPTAQPQNLKPPNGQPQDIQPKGTQPPSESAPSPPSDAPRSAPAKEPEPIRQPQADSKKPNSVAPSVEPDQEGPVVPASAQENQLTDDSPKD